MRCAMVPRLSQKDSTSFSYWSAYIGDIALDVVKLPHPQLTTPMDICATFRWLRSLLIFISHIPTDNRLTRFYCKRAQLLSYFSILDLLYICYWRSLVKLLACLAFQEFIIASDWLIALLPVSIWDVASCTVQYNMPLSALKAAERVKISFLGRCNKGCDHHQVTPFPSSCRAILTKHRFHVNGERCTRHL